jgi:hypothetical protein
LFAGHTQGQGAVSFARDSRLGLRLRAAHAFHGTVAHWRRPSVLTASLGVATRRGGGGTANHEVEVEQASGKGGVSRRSALTIPQTADEIDVDGSHELGASANAGAKVGHGAGRRRVVAAASDGPLYIRPGHVGKGVKAHIGGIRPIEV